jgi:hypothetical protein
MGTDAGFQTSQTLRQSRTSLISSTACIFAETFQDQAQNVPNGDKSVSVQG